jgi:Mn-dependent DtxR family transcriptional regulator
MAELEALAELGTAEPSAIHEHLPARLGVSSAYVRADLQRLEKKGLVRRVSGFTLTDEGRELLAAALKIREIFPGRGARSNGAAEADE